MSVWDEVGDGVFRRRYASLDLNIGLVLGETGAVVIDTRASHRQARELRDDLAVVTDLPVRWVINTHWHWDHVFGNALFPEAELWGHVQCRRVLLDHGEAQKQGAIEWVGEAYRAVIEEVEIVPPEHTVDPSGSLDLGDRVVEMVWLGKGHTDADLVVTVPDAGVTFAGDLLENGAPPYFGDGYPMAWGATAEALEARMTEVTVPGHGDVMDRAAVTTQVAELAAIGAACREAVATGEFDPSAGPYPVETMQTVWQRARQEAGAA